MIAFVDLFTLFLRSRITLTSRDWMLCESVRLWSAGSLLPGRGEVCVPAISSSYFVYAQ